MTCSAIILRITRPWPLMAVLIACCALLGAPPGAWANDTAVASEERVEEQTEEQRDEDVVDEHIDEPAEVIPESEGESAPAEQAAQDKPRTAALIEVFGVINRRQNRYVERVLNEAIKAEVDLIVTRIESPGGELGAALDLLDMVIRKSRGDGPRIVAWIDKEAYSAAALLAYGHHEIYMKPHTIIGDIGIIFRGPEGDIQYAPEKFETAVRAIMRATSEERGWNKALLMKMTARNQHLYEARFTDPDTGEKRVEYILEDDKGTFLANHPFIDTENREQWILLFGEDRLITFTASEAVERQMATGLVDNIDELWEVLGVEADQVLNLSPTPVELTARKLGMFAPIFISLAILFIFLEFKTPGVGIFIILAAVCGGIFFFMQYYQDLVTNWAIILIVLGMILILVEIFTFAGGGMLGAGGAIIAFVGILGAFLPSNFSWDFDDAAAREALRSAMLNLAVTIVILIGGAVSFIALAPRLPFLDRISNVVSLQGNSSGAIEQLTANNHSRQPRYGVTVAECHPSGTVNYEGRNYSARAEHSAFIPAGTEVEVLSSQFGELLVRPRRSATPDNDSNSGAPA